MPLYRFLVGGWNRVDVFAVGLWEQTIALAPKEILMADYVSTFPLSTLYRFPVFQTREAYQSATGLEAPPYDASKPLKSWFDPNPAAIGSVVLYSHPIVGLDGKVVEEPLLLKVADAKAINIPPKAPGVPDLPAAEGEIPVPCRPLLATEQYVVGFGGIIEVRDATKVPTNSVPGGFTDADRSLLKAIGEKLGIPTQP